MKDFKKLFPYIRPNLALLAFALVMLLLSGAMEALTTAMLAPIFNQLRAESAKAGPDKFAFLLKWLGLGSDDSNLLLKIAALVVIFSFLKGIFLFVAEYLMGYSGQKVVMQLRNLLYSHLLNQSIGFFSRNSTGKLMARVITDVERIQETVSKTLTDFFRQGTLLGFFLALVIYTDPKLAGIAFLLAPVILWLTAAFGKKMRKISWSSQEKIAAISNFLQETITGIRVVKAFGMENFENRKFQSATRDLMRTNMRSTAVSALNSPLMEFIGYVAFVPFLIYAHYKIHDPQHPVNLGEFIVFLTALFRLYDPMRRLSKMHLHFQQALASSSRIFEVLETHFEVRDKPNAQLLEPLRHTIEFHDVGFHYGDSDRPQPILTNIRLKIKTGELVALVGSSGAGKSTLVNLIPRFYDVTSGNITFDGVDIRDVTVESLRGQISIVTQETFLFNDTVRNNIAYGNSLVSQATIEQAAEAALIHDFIQQLPLGYDSIIGERGQRLSGGQRQRIAIARAILKDAPVLILDEATSSLDTESEKLVQMALQNLMMGRTTVVIAHRLSTVRRANRILVMEHGRIVEEGKHGDLILRNGQYNKFYRLQFHDADDAAVLGAKPVHFLKKRNP
ncbi:MAG TPA: ABC transporter transmembrane domain-containing protein [Acidobacteriota bacterium]|nr:ABC transporter transmembrane domain-containing protein [Acidobacteriota bacterium]